MKRTIKGLLLVTLLAISFTAFSQKEKKKFRFGFGIEGGIVTGDFKDLYNIAGGITLRGSFSAGPGYITLTSGAVAYVPKDFENEELDLKAGLQIPVKAGYKYPVGKHFFVMGELGYSSFTVYSPDEINEDEILKEKFSGFTYAPSVGADFGAFEVALKYETVSGIAKSSLSNIRLRLGFNF